MERGVGSREQRLGRLASMVGMLLLLVALAIMPRSAAHATSIAWPTFLGNRERSGFNGAETIIDKKLAPHLKLHWKIQAGGHISTQPIAANGLLYWGSWDGKEHATNPSTGVDAWATKLGQTAGKCVTDPYGVLSTSTFAIVPVKGVQTPIVFVGGGDVQLYALNANTGAIIWHTPLGTQPDYFLFSATAVFNGSVYIGVSSLGDCPLVRGRIVQVNASTGKIQHTFNSVPSACTGGSVWGSPTLDQGTGMIYFGTGNGGNCSTPESMATALVQLRASDFSFVGSWQVPPSQRITDGDFGSTPTLFKATIGGVAHQMVGLENKNGIFYAFDRTHIGAGPLWQAQIALPPPPTSGSVNISSSAFDGNALYVAGASTTIGGKSCGGSLRALNPATGTFTWQDCFADHVFSPVMAVPGLAVIGAGTSFFVASTTEGTTLFTFTDTTMKKADFWGAATIINGVLYEGNMDGILYDFGP